MKIRTQVTRRGKAAAILHLYKRSLGKRAEVAMLRAARVLMDESLLLVPRDTEALASSARITQEGYGLDAVIYVGYGGKDTPPKVLWSPERERFLVKIPSNYAWVQHNIHALNHPNGGQADYLGEPSRTKLREMAQAFLEGLREK